MFTSNSEGEKERTGSTLTDPGSGNRRPALFGLSRTLNSEAAAPALGVCTRTLPSFREKSVYSVNVPHSQILSCPVSTAQNLLEPHLLTCAL